MSKRKKKKGVKKSNVHTGPCANSQRHFCLISSLIFFLQFSFHFGENFLVDPERKHLGLNIYFPPSSPNQTHSKKIFIFIFSKKKNFIYPISPMWKEHFSLSTKIIWRGHLYTYMCSISTYVSRKIWSSLVCRQKALIINTNP